MKLNTLCNRFLFYQNLEILGQNKHSCHLNPLNEFGNLIGEIFV